MAGLWFGHFDSTPSDPRALLAHNWARYIMSFITSGIRNGGTCLQVSAGTGMLVNVDEGVANVNGYIMRVDADYEGRYYKVLVPEAHPQHPRIDRLVLRLDVEPGNGMAGHVKPFILQGTAAASPIAPTLTRNTKTWELSLARIRVNANTLVITPADITDERFDTGLCGLMNSILGLDPSAWQKQFDDFIAGLLVQEKDFLAAHGKKFDEQLNAQAGEFAAKMAGWTNTVEGWYYSVRHDITKLQTFSFDNLAALVGAAKNTTFGESGGAENVTEIIRNAYTQNKIAERFTTFIDDDNIHAVMTVYDADGKSVLKRTEITTVFGAGDAIKQTVTGEE